MMSDPIVRVQAEAPPVDVAVQTDVPDAVVRIEVANQGKDGYTPKRGVDYWTEEDVQEIHDYVDEQIGTGGSGSGAVSSVNGKTGAVILTPEDVGAQPAGDYALKKELPSVPTRLSQLEQDANHRLATDAEKAAWDAKSDFSGKYADLEGKPDIPQIDDAAVSAESTWSSKNTVERFLPEFSESGAAVECHPFPLCPLNVSTTFEPAQTGSGDPYPAGGGKNLLENTVATRTVNGIAFTVNKDGTVTVNGTATADAWLEMRRFSADAPNFSGCVMSGCPAGGGLNTYFLRWSNNAAASATDDGKSTCVIPDAHTGSAIIAICVKSGVTASNLIFKPMIRLASITDDTYAPYSNIRPISGHDSLSMTRCGKNLLPNNAQTQTINGVTFTVNADGSVTANGTANATIYYVIGTYDAQPDVSYVLSGCPQGGGMNTYNLYSKYADRDDAYAYDIGGGVSFTAPASRNNMVTLLIHPGVVMTDVVFKPMLRLSTETDATYEPYQGDTYIAHLGDTVYGGTYDWSKGELVAEWAMKAFDGTEAWWIAPCKKGYCARLPQAGQGIGVIDRSCASSHYPIKTTDEIYANPVLGISYSVIGQYVALADNRIIVSADSLDDFKSYLAAQYAVGTPVQIAYKLAIPITIRLAPSEIMPLDGTNVLSSDPGNTTVSGKLDPIYLHEQNKAAAAKLAGMETRLRALESAAVNNA